MLINSASHFDQPCLADAAVCYRLTINT